MSIGDAAATWIVWTDFDRDAVTWEDSNIKLAHSAADRSEDDEPVVALHAKHRVRQRFLDDAVELQLVALRLFSFPTLTHLLADSFFCSGFFSERPTALRTRAVTSSTDPTPSIRLRFPRFS